MACGTLIEMRVKDMAPIVRETALVRRVRSGPLSPAASKLVALLRAEAEALGLGPRGRAPDAR